MTPEREAQIRAAVTAPPSEDSILTPEGQAVLELLTVVDDQRAELAFIREEYADADPATLTLGAQKMAARARAYQMRTARLPVLPDCFSCGSWHADENGDSACLHDGPHKHRELRIPGAPPPAWCPHRREQAAESATPDEIWRWATLVEAVVDRDDEDGLRRDIVLHQLASGALGTAAEAYAAAVAWAGRAIR